MRFFPLRTRQCQPVVHMPFTVQNCLKTHHLQLYPTDSFAKFFSPTLLVNCQWLSYYSNTEYTSSPFAELHPYGTWHQQLGMLARAQRLHVEENKWNLHIWSPGFPSHQHQSLCWCQASPKHKKCIKYSYFSNFSLLINTKNSNKWHYSLYSVKTQNTTDNVQCISHITPHLWWSKAEGGCIDVSFVPINQLQTFLLCKTQVSSSSNVAQSKWLAPACMPTTPAGKHQERKPSTPQHLVIPHNCQNPH